MPRRRAPRAASRAPRSWKCAQERHQLDPLCTKGKRRLMGSVETYLLLYVQTECGRSHQEPITREKWVDACLYPSRMKNGVNGLMENGTHALHGNPTMTGGLIAKRTLSQFTSIGI
ncbi:hypothetical protein TNCV_4761121 [Trichonephila clavipes]|uniref:Uncharacterized protein n=1 Tax=Trichonephila clavipes TaxID=2585209 RepID=A0A8X6RDY5_TRICX|nr:hypothetical protein TNCV_4761121 [Trichonephila clavipes]